MLSIGRGVGSVYRLPLRRRKYGIILSMSTDHNIPDVDTGIPGGAVSLYGGQDGLDDFPVLKAFQQYVDAEQAKARKRMIQLCIFFAVLMSVVIGIFVTLIIGITNRNQALNDRLVEQALKDRQPVVMPQPAAPSAGEEALRAMADSMSNMQKQLIEQQSRLAEQQLKLAEQAVKNAAAATAAAPQPAPPVAHPASNPNAEQSAAKAAEEKLKSAREKLKAEREAIAKERESLRMQEIELQRRRLYPELYDENGRLLPPRPQVAKPQAAPVQPQPAAPAAAKQDEDDDMSEIYAAIEKEANAIGGTGTERPEPIDDGAITYFQEEPEEAPKPKAAKPKPAKQQPAKQQAAKPKAKKPAKQEPAGKADESAASGWRIPLD